MTDTLSLYVQMIGRATRDEALTFKMPIHKPAKCEILPNHTGKRKAQWKDEVAQYKRRK